MKSTYFGTQGQLVASKHIKTYLKPLSVPDPNDMKDLYNNCKIIRDDLYRHDDTYKEHFEDEEGIYPACRK